MTQPTPPTAPPDFDDAFLREAAQVDLAWIQPPPPPDRSPLPPHPPPLLTPPPAAPPPPPRVPPRPRPPHAPERAPAPPPPPPPREPPPLGNGCATSPVAPDPQYTWATTPPAPADPANVAFHLAPLVVREFG